MQVEIKVSGDTKDPDDRELVETLVELLKQQRNNKK